MATSATASSSSRVKTTPVGLWGEFSNSTLVRGVIAARSLSMSGRNPGPDRGTPTRTPSASDTQAA